MEDTELLDKEMTAINTPAAAVKYYLPFLVSGKMDLMAIKKELKEVHQFSKVDISITAQSLVRAHTQHQRENPFSFSREIRFTLALLMIGGGIFLALLLWETGFIAVLPFILISGGVGLLFQALRQG